jgi:ectoine hydroxylase-related dioxygenase (phytanoyl-CoA dioxygenase family)
MHRLTPADKQFYQEQGYLLPKLKVFPDQDFQALRQYFEQLRDEWENQHGIRPEHMDVPHLYHPELYQWLCHDQILDLVEDIVGPDIVLFSSHFICKPAGIGKRVPWHEDSAYWAHYDIDPLDIVTVWLSIDESSPENGCMRIIPGSHKTADSTYGDLSSDDHSVFSTEINSDQFDESTAVDCVLKANQASLHHGKLIHGSHANTSNKRRCGYTMRYMSSHCKLKNIGNHRIFLARGQDHSGNQYSEIGQVYREHAQAV